jgi:enoyl-CoA hydratase
MFDTTIDGTVATVRMNVGAVNAMDRDALDGLLATFQQIDADPAVHAVVLTGNDRAFCAGVDLRRILDGGEEYTRPFVEVLGRAILAPLRVHQPVIAAVNGHAVALGALLAAACDHVVCTDDPRARIGLAELNVGVAFPTGAIEVARRRLGPNLGRAVWLAELFGAEDALRLGFVDEVVPADQVLSRATEIADGLGSRARHDAATDPRTACPRRRGCHRRPGAGLGPARGRPVVLRRGARCSPGVRGPHAVLISDDGAGLVVVRSTSAQFLPGRTQPQGRLLQDGDGVPERQAEVIGGCTRR